jgi:ATP:ADP antiporter, AAA family
VNPSHKLQALLNLQPGEGRLVFLLLLQYFFMGMAFTFTQTTAFTLFFTEFDSQTLSLSYIPMAVIVTLLTFGYLQVSQRVSFMSLLTVNLGGLLVITVLFGFGLTVIKASWLIFALPMLFQIVVNFGNLAFWSLAGRLFNVRQGKRLFGLVGAGQWIAIVITGFLMPAIVAWLSLVNLLWLAAVGLAGALTTMLTITRLYRNNLVAPAASTAPTTQAQRPAANDSALRRLLRNRYVRLIFALVLTWWLVFFFLDNIFYGRAAVQYPNPAELAGFLGTYLGCLGILTLLSNFFISGRLINRYGLRLNLLLLPIGLAVGTMIMTTAGVLGLPLVLLFWATMATKVWDMAVGFSIDQSARTILYQPLPAHLRLRVQTLADGMVQPLAIGLAGVALLVLNGLSVASPLPLIIGLLVVVGALLVIAVFIGREYAVVLLQALTTRRLTATDLVVSDAASIAILKQGLRSLHAGVVIYSARMLEEVEPTVLAALLPELLKHAAPEVRHDALDRIARLRLQAALPAVQECVLLEASPVVKGVALRTLARLGDREVSHDVLGYLDDPQPSVKAGAIVGMLTSGEVESTRDASRKLFELIDSPQATDRVLAAQILGECDLNSYYEPLMTLMGDPDPHVRRATLRSAGQLKSARLWPGVLAALASPSTRSAAAAALIAGGEGVLPDVAAAFERAETDRAVRIQLTNICGRIRGAAAIGLLKTCIDVIDVDLRSATLRALSQCGYRAQGPDSALVPNWIRNEIRHAAWLLAAVVDVGAPADAALLQSALTDQVARSRDRVLTLLSFRGDAPALSRARDNLLRGPADKHAYALEVIDIQTPQELKAGVLPLLENISPEQRWQRLSGLFPQPRLERGPRLRELALNSERRLNAWTQTCALYTANALALPDLPEIVTPLLTAPQPLIRETAAWFYPLTTTGRREERMLSTIEKVIILKTVSIFAETDDEVLAEVAAITTELAVSAGQTIFEKGDRGDSLYMIATGRVRVHDGDRTLNDLVTGNVFGEMAVLDPEPRSASVTAVEDTQLLRLDQQALYELIDDRPEVARGLIQVLSQHLRNRMRDLADLRDRAELRDRANRVDQVPEPMQS